MSTSRSRFASVAAAGLAGALLGFLAGLGVAWLGASGSAAPLDPEEEADPQALKDAVLARLAADTELAQRPVQVSVLAPGIVELAGAVASRAEALRAARRARRVAGVRTVLNRLVAPEELVARDELRARMGSRRTREPKPDVGAAG